MSSGQPLKSFKQSYMSLSKSSAGRCDGKYNYVCILTFEIALHGTSLFTEFQSKQLCWATWAHIIINKIDSHTCPLWCLVDGVLSTSEDREVSG